MYIDGKIAPVVGTSLVVEGPSADNVIAAPEETERPGASITPIGVPTTASIASPRGALDEEIIAGGVAPTAQLQSGIVLVHDDVHRNIAELTTVSSESKLRKTKSELVIVEWKNA